MKVVFFGTVDLGPGYPRSRALLQALERLGGGPEIVTVPLVEGPLHRACRGVRGGVRLALGLLRARRALAARARRCASPDLVVVGYPAHTAAGLARRLWPEALIVQDMMLSLLDTAAGDRGICRLRSPLGRLLAAWDRYTVGQADLVLADTEEMGDYLAELTGRDRRHFLALPCGDPDAPTEEDDFTYRPPGPGEELRALFFGTGVPLQGVETILAAAGLVERTRVTLVGGGPAADGRHGNPVDRIEGWVDRTGIRRLLRESHLSLGIFGPGRKAARVVPLKVYNALAEGLPVLTGDTPAVRRLLAPEQEVLLVPRDDPRALADRLDELARDPKRLAATAAAGRRAFRERFAAPVLARILGERLAALGLDLPDRSPAPRLEPSGAAP